MNQIDGVISVKDLFAELVRKCWLIIICIVVFAVALGGYKFVRNMQAQQNIDEEVKELTEEDLELVDEYVAKYQEYEGLVEYFEDSIYLKLNPYNVYRVELQYLITGDVKDKDLATIRAAYADYALFGRLASDIAANNDEYGELALKEIIETDGDIREQDNTLKTVRIMILAQNEEQAEELAACVKEQIEAYTKEINKTIAPHEFELLDENMLHFFKTELIGKRDEFTLRMQDLEDQVDMLEGQLSSVQMSYALELLGDEAEEEEVEETGKPSIGLKSILKFAILGGALGGAFAVVLVVALYFFTNQIKNEKEVEYTHQIPHLGNCCIYESKGFDKLADDIFFKNKTRDVEAGVKEITEKLAEVCKENKVTEICFVGIIDERAKQIIGEIRKALEKHGVAATAEESVATKEGNLPQNIVHVEILRKTSGEDVAREINFCKEHELTLCGYITFSK